MKKLIIIICLFFIQFGFAQSKDPDEILKNVITNFNKVNDYVLMLI